MILLPGENVLIVWVNKIDAWIYLYNSKMGIIKEINSTIPKKHYLQKLTAVPNNIIEYIFYIDNVNKKNCVPVLQVVNLT